MCQPEKQARAEREGSEDGKKWREAGVEGKEGATDQRNRGAREERKGKVRGGEWTKGGRRGPYRGQNEKSTKK
jgi:hypothetical protein